MTTRISMNLLALCCLLLWPLAACAAEAGSASGFWSGTAAADGEVTALNLHVNDDGEGNLSSAIDLPDVGVAGWPAQSIQFDGESGLEVVIPSDNGPQPLSLSLDGDSLTGAWQMPGFDTPSVISLGRAEAPGEAFTEMGVTFQSGELSMGGTIIVPRGDGPYPGVVYLHGSGDTTRAVNRFAAEQMATRGIASIIFDKRGTGASEGAWRDVGFYELAADGIAAAEALAAIGNVDASRIGFSGQSQGGWIGPLAAARWEQAAFVIALAGPATTPAEEGHWSVIWSLMQSGASDEVVAQADSILSLWDEGIRTGDFDAFNQAITEVEGEDWYAGSGLSDFAGELPAWVLAWYGRVLDFDPLPVIRQMNASMLSMLGSQDASIPAARSAELLRGLAEEGEPVTVVYYEGYDHTLRLVSPDGAAQRWPNQPSDLYDAQVAFIQAATAE